MLREIFEVQRKVIGRLRVMAVIKGIPVGKLGMTFIETVLLLHQSSHFSAVCQVAAAAHGFMVIQGDVVSHHIIVPGFVQLHAEVHIVIGNRIAFVKSSDLVIPGLFYDQAGCGNGEYSEGGYARRDIWARPAGRQTYVRVLFPD